MCEVDIVNLENDFLWPQRGQLCRLVTYITTRAT